MKPFSLSGCAEKQWCMVLSHQNASKLQNTVLNGQFYWLWDPILLMYRNLTCGLKLDQKWALSYRRLVEAYHVTAPLPKINTRSSKEVYLVAWFCCGLVRWDGWSPRCAVLPAHVCVGCSWLCNKQVQNWTRRAACPLVYCIKYLLDYDKFFRKILNQLRKARSCRQHRIVRLSLSCMF